jgi:hypothetical protein
MKFPYPVINEKYYKELDMRIPNPTGRVLFCLNVLDDVDICGEGNGITFICGYEDKDDKELLGGDEDLKLQEFLKQIFNDMTIETGIAENIHYIEVKQGDKNKKIWKIIQERLEEAGAIHVVEDCDQD